MATKAQLNTLDKALQTLPYPVGDAYIIAGRQEWNEPAEMYTRRKEFADPRAALYTAAFQNPKIYEEFDRLLDEGQFQALAYVRAGSFLYEDTVIIGSGITAAVYAAKLAEENAGKGTMLPLVLEREQRAGGTFGMTRKPAFRLNNRNRAGELGFPGSTGSLSYIPGAVVQPADLNADEYQFNNAVGFAIRATLARYARVATGVEVKAANIYENGRYVQIVLEDGTTINANRVIIATGFGDEQRPAATGPGRITFSQFMRRIDTQPYPMRGLKRVAVIGAGDGGRTVIEALTGQGAPMGMSVMSFDRPERIDWYGPGVTMTKSSWREQNRSRYDGIARVLPRDAYDRNAVVTPKNRAGYTTPTQDGGCRVDGERYDLVIEVTGYVQPAGIQLETSAGEDNRPLAGALIYSRYGVDTDLRGPGGEVVAKKVRTLKAWLAGPAAELPLSAEESRAYPSGIPENTAAIFRYADRTAQLASMLARGEEQGTLAFSDEQRDYDEYRDEDSDRYRDEY